MAQIPVLVTRDQLIGMMVRAFQARVKGIDDLNTGSVLSQIFESVGQINFKTYADIVSMVDALSSDRAVGESLQRLARDKNVPILAARASSGKVSITDLSFEKIQSSVYTGQPAPVAGSLKVYVADASKFKATGTIYIGRGTPNVEGPLTYTAVTSEAGGSYWSITLSGSTPTAKFHNIGETVVLGQGGDRDITAGTVVRTPQGSATTSVSFVTTASSKILDGEVTVTDIPVVAQQVGPVGNVPKGAIKEVVGLAFNAKVTNDQPFSFGKDADNDDIIRDRIKQYEQLKSKGTEAAIRAAAIDVVAPDELKRVSSSSSMTRSDNTGVLVFDDGAGYEPLFDGVGTEPIVDEAVGGETNLQLRKKPIAQARIESGLSAPFNINDFAFLAVEISGEESVHQFRTSSFKVPSAATAFEVASSINGDATCAFLASTSRGGTRVVIYPKNPKLNDIKVNEYDGDDANLSLGFPKTQEFTARIYKNDKPLYQDGLLARISTRTKSSWSSSISDGDTLTYIVDDTIQITTVFNLAAFQAIEPASIPSNAAPISVWAAVLNSLMPGVIATVNGERIDLDSNRGRNANARLQIVGGTLRDKIFEIGAVLDSQGRNSDYTLNRQTSQIALTDPLQIGDSVTAGSPFTRARVITAPLPSGPLNTGRVWFVIDGQAQSIVNNMQSSTEISFERTLSSPKMTIKARNASTLNPTGFDAVRPGDWLLVWSNPTDPAGFIAREGYWRVEEAEVGRLLVNTSDTTLLAPGTWYSVNVDRIVITRSEAPVQKLSFAVQALSAFAASIQDQIAGVNTEIIGSQVRISTKTFDENIGEVFVVAADNGGKALELPIGEASVNIPSHLGFSAVSDSEAGSPSFTHGAIDSVVDADTFGDADYLDLGGTEDDFFEFLDKADTTNLLPVYESNRHRRVFATLFNAGNVETIVPSYMSAGNSLVQAGDRYFLRSSFQFDSRDTATVVVDNSLELKSYTNPVARRLQVSNNSTPTIQSFSASDLESDLALSAPASFGAFSFLNFKAWRQAAGILTDGTYEIRVNYFDFGPSGNKARVGFRYPSSIDQTVLSHQTDSEETTNIAIRLPVITPRTATWDGSSAFTTSVVTTDGKDEVTFTWRVGTEPDFTGTGSDLSVGDIGIISIQSNFIEANRGISARVVSFSATSFTLELPTGTVVPDSVAFVSAQNLNGILTITSSGAHNVNTGNKVGIWDSAEVSSGFAPFDTTYIASRVSSTVFTVATPANVPGGPIQSGTHVGSNLITITAANHGLQPGNIIQVYNVSTGQYNGLYPVRAILNANQFTYIRSGTSPAIANDGRFDFQPLEPGVTASSITSAAKSGGLVTITAINSLAPNDVVEIVGMNIADWNIGTAYAAGDVIEYSGTLYKALTSTTGDQPDTSPSEWSPSTADLSGSFVVESANGTSFTYRYDDTTGDTAATGGTFRKYAVTAKLARSVGAQTGMLGFAEVGTTAQEVVDYITNNMPQIIGAQISGGDPTDPITVSTEDLDAGSDYLSGTVDSINTFSGSRTVEIVTDTEVPAGGSIKVTAASPTNYNGEYVVLKSEQSGSDWVLTAQSGILATSTASISLTSGEFVGSRQYVMLADGANSILSQNLAATPSNPQFMLKKAWQTAPAVGEEIRLIATNADQLVRFWNQLIVTGLSNVAKVENSYYGRQIQIATNTFGSKGSVQVIGGYANGGTVALVSSGISTDKVGIVSIPYELRRGLNAGHWIKLDQQIRQNKNLGFTAATGIRVYNANDGIEVDNATPGLFSVKRAAAHDYSTKFKVERHGAFVAFVRVSGTSPGLSTANVEEGDWVRIKNVIAKTYNSASTYLRGSKVKQSGAKYIAIQNVPTATTPPNGAYWKQYSEWSGLSNYAIGDYVEYVGRMWISLVASGPGNGGAAIPGSDATKWQQREFNPTNNGIFQVVRIFGEDSFWIKNDNIVEEIVDLLDPNDLSFYTNDSVMPGDTLNISGTILGQTNVGRYTVTDDTDDESSNFPTAKRIWTQAIPDATGGYVVLGNNLNLVSVEEAEPVSLYKRIFAIGPGASGEANVVLDSPNLVYKLSSSLGAFLTMENKLEFGTDINYGIDGYKFFKGLISQLNRVIYGDPVSPINYPGVRAAGAYIDIQPSIIKRIQVSLSIRIKTGISFVEIQDKVKAAVAGYVNTLGAGQAVALSEVVSAARTVNGVISVAITSPVFTAASDLIAVGADERALIVDPSVDVVVSIIGS